MRLLWVLACCALISSHLGFGQSPANYQNHLLPVPAHVEVQPGRLPIDGQFKVSLDGVADKRLASAANRFLDRIEGRTAIQLLHDLGKDPAARLIVRVKSTVSAAPQLGDDESYAVEVTPTQTVLTANQTVGAIRGFETILQLLDGDKDGFYLPLVKIQDAPRFPWRGLHIDVARHFEPVEVIKRELDGMSAVKLNVFHWHLSDDQGFRIESKRYPKLQEMGSDGQYYTQEQVKEVVTYAADRGIRVVPEFDIPGHSTAWFVGYPAYASAPGPYQIERRFGIFDPTFNPTDENVYKFFEGFFGEMAKLFPDAYMHIGGDETKGTQWDANPKIQAFKKKKGLKDNAALQAYFNKRIEIILKKHGKKMVGWDEILHPDLPKDIVVQSWRGEKSLIAGAKQGYRGILSAPYYLDHQDSAAFHYKADPLPAGSDVTPEQSALILGGEACMWSEHINSESIDSRIWPRLAAVAERLWSPREVQDPADMYRRLDRVSLQLEELGLQHEAHSDRMLREIMGTRDVEAFSVFLDTLMPASFGQRSHGQKTTQLTPLTRLVDTVVPDPPSGREFQTLVDELLADTPNYQRNGQQLNQMFATWRSTAPTVSQIIESHPQLQEAAPRAAELEGLGQLGQEALNYLQTKTSPPPQWLVDSNKKLDEAAKPKGLVRYAVAESLRKLVQATIMPTLPAEKVGQ